MVPAERTFALKSKKDLPMTEPSSSQAKPARRGFAAMDKDRQREIARKGGASVPDEKRSFSQDRDLAASAGRKGGEASHGGGRRRGSANEATQRS